MQRINDFYKAHAEQSEFLKTRIRLYEGVLENIKSNRANYDNDLYYETNKELVELNILRTKGLLIQQEKYTEYYKGLLNNEKGKGN